MSENNAAPQGNNAGGALPPAPPPPAFYEALVNRLTEPRPQSIKSVPCEIFKSGDDFDLWVVSFVDNVRASHNMTETDARLNGLCLNWISTKLAVGPTRSVYDNLTEATKRNWPALKQALSSAYRNESEEIRFLNNDDAWSRDNLALIDYKNGLLHRMTKYQPELKNVQAEWERTLVRRFRAGLKDPALEAHILMACQTPGNHTLDRAYTIACNYENTLQTIGQKQTKTAAPNMAAMSLLVPQMASLSVDTPQISALTSLQEKTNDRISALETSAKKHELDVSELKASLSEIKDGLKSVKEEIVCTKASQPYQRPAYQRPIFQRPVKPLYPVARTPMSQHTRPFYQQGARPKVVQGLTGGPGYVLNQPQTQSQVNPQPNGQAQQNLQSQSTQIGKTQANPLAFPQRPPGSVLGAMEEQTQGEGESVNFANPNLQYGSHDNGYGWTGADLNDAYAHGYDMAPEGVFVYSDLPF